MRPNTDAATRTSAGTSTHLGALLWTIQILLALLFLFAGVMKFILPIEMMTKDLPLPGPFLRFIGVAEVAGALGLVLPGLLRLSPILTPLAAGGLVIIMIGATIVTLATGKLASAVVPAVVGLLAAFVAYRHWRVALRRRSVSTSMAQADEPTAAVARHI